MNPQKRRDWLRIILALLVVGTLLYVLFLSSGPNSVTDSFYNFQQTLDGKNVEDPQPVVAETVIYFSKAKGTENVLEAVPRPVPEQWATKPMEYVITELLKGPNHNESMLGYFSEIPKGTRLIDIQETPEVIYVNLSQQFAKGGGANSMQQRLSEMAQTLQSIEQDKPVQIKVEGERLEILGGEGVEITEPVNQTVTDPR